MKKIFLAIIFMISVSLIFAQNIERFNKYFYDETMRIDYFHIGDAAEEFITLDQVHRYGIWAGSRINLIDNFNNGRYCFKIYDAESWELLYSKGFDSFFGEYKTSRDGIDGIERTYHETAIIPYPKNSIIFAIEKRANTNEMFEIFRREINPDDVSIIKDEIKDKLVKVYRADFNADPHERVDIAILSEGYTIDERKKFEEDLKYFHDVFFKYEPYKSLENSFNIYGVFKPSEDTGVDEPRADIFKRTALNCTFNSLGSERYLQTEDNKSVRNLAAHVPYDALYIMVNHDRYGGGGIYNTYCTFTTGNQFKDYLFVHEFGHSFAGLADEYYTSDVQYNDFYPQGIEPVEPNITALTNLSLVKWEEYLSSNIAVPTPWEKAEYDSMDYKWQKERREMNNNIAELKKNKSSEITTKKAEEEYAQKDKEHSDWVDRYLMSSKYSGMVGVFEGAGYSAKGLYRPMVDCIMFSKGDKPFCRVCANAISKVIKHYTEVPD